MKLQYRHTAYACYLAYITQAIVNNLAPLLFVTFQKQFSLTLESISLLIMINFSVQIGVDLLSSLFIHKIGYRAAVVGAHILTVAGLSSMAFLPFLLPSPYAGLVIAVILNAVGGGLIEVLISPIIEALPGSGSAARMSLLHSFYCWGQMGVVLLATIFFVLAGLERWFLLPLLFCLLPFLTGFLFTGVPIRTLEEKQGETMSLKTLLRTKAFWMLLAMMVCAGASELAVSQWSSFFAENGLGVSKTAGDLPGPLSVCSSYGLQPSFIRTVRESVFSKPHDDFILTGLCRKLCRLRILSHPLHRPSGCGNVRLLCRHYVARRFQPFCRNKGWNPYVRAACPGR